MEKTIGLKKISTTLPADIVFDCKQKGYSWKELIIRGRQHMETFPDLLARVRKQEEALLKLNAIIVKQAEKVMCLEHALNQKK